MKAELLSRPNLEDVDPKAEDLVPNDLCFSEICSTSESGAPEEVVKKDRSTNLSLHIVSFMMQFE